jgi:hypothetical protein
MDVILAMTGDQYEPRVFGIYSSREMAVSDIKAKHPKAQSWGETRFGELYAKFPPRDLGGLFGIVEREEVFWFRTWVVDEGEDTP